MVTVMTVEELERKYDELTTILAEMDGEADMARRFGCSSLIPESFWEDKDRLCKEIDDVRGMLKGIWQSDPFALNGALSKEFEEERKIDEALFELGYWWDDNGNLNYFEPQAR